MPRLPALATVRALMRLLDRYLLRELLPPLAYCLGGFLITFIAFDLFNSLSEFQRDQLTAGDILEFYFDRTPEFLVTSYVVPLSLLLALLYSLTAHARHNELTAMRAAAISLWRIAAPYFAVGVLLSFVVLFVSEQLLPEGVDAANRVRLRHAEEAKEAQKLWKRNVFFQNPIDNRAWRIGAYQMQQNVMWKPQFDWQRRDGTRLRIIAERARWTHRQWVFLDVTNLEFSAVAGALPTISYTNQMAFPGFMETPRVIQSEIKIGAVEGLRSLRKMQISSVEILDYLKLHPGLERKKDNELRTMFHSRMAAPWICLVVVLIALPFGAAPGRRNAFVGVASSVSICFVFFVMNALAFALGSGGYVPPWVAAWLPNSIFALTGLALMWRVR